jgi:tetratricopeptide (TPR) repeat protein
MVLFNRREARTRQVQALTQAFEHRDRLPQRERYVVEATYYRIVTAEYEKAIEAYEDHLAAYPNDRDTWVRNAKHNMAIAYNGLRQYERAEEILRQIIIEYPRSPSGLPGCWTAQWVLAQALVNQGKLEDANSTAEDCGWTSLSEDNHPWPHWNGFAIAAAQGDYQTAEKHLEMVLDGEAGPFWKNATVGALATLSAVRGQLAEAERLDGEASFEIAQRDLFIRQDPPRALQRLQAELEKAPLADIDPLDRPYLEIAILYAQAGRADLALAMLAEFESVVEPRLRGPARYEYARARGEIALAEGRYEDAIAEFRASDVGYCMTCAFPGLIRSYDAAGEPDSVAALLERYVATPDIMRLSEVDHAHLGPALERLGQLYDDRGDGEQAAEYYGRFVELWKDADRELQPRVQAAQERLDEILAVRG